MCTENGFKLGINAGTSDPTDGRNISDWESKYPKDATKRIRMEAYYLLFLFICSFILIYANWNGYLADVLLLSGPKAQSFVSYFFYASAGLLGGVVFDIKYLIRVVARGYWHLDRQLWRIFSPLLGLSIGFIIGLMVNSAIIKVPYSGSSGAIQASIGFMSGYFADLAFGKMFDIAKVIFGNTTSSKEREHQ